MRPASRGAAGRLSHPLPVPLALRQTDLATFPFDDGRGEESQMRQGGIQGGRPPLCSCSNSIRVPLLVIGVDQHLHKPFRHHRLSQHDHVHKTNNHSLDPIRGGLRAVLISNQGEGVEQGRGRIAANRPAAAAVQCNARARWPQQRPQEAAAAVPSVRPSGAMRNGGGASALPRPSVRPAAGPSLLPPPSLPLPSAAMSKLE